MVGSTSGYEPADTVQHSSQVITLPGSLVPGDVIAYQRWQTGEYPQLPSRWKWLHQDSHATFYEIYESGKTPASYTIPFVDWQGNPSTVDEHHWLCAAFRWSPTQNINGPLDPFWYNTGWGYASNYHANGDGVDLSDFLTGGPNSLIIVGGFHRNYEWAGAPASQPEPPLTFSTTPVGVATSWDTSYPTGGHGNVLAGIEHPGGGQSGVITITIPSSSDYDGWDSSFAANSVTPGDIPCFTSVV